MLLKPGVNVWRVERAARAAVLVDGAAYFRAVREALIRARHSVIIVGWDIHSRTRLVGETGRAEDGFPEPLAEFLSALVRRRPDLNVCLLLWDYSMLYAMERELFPTLTLRWSTPRQVRFCLDNAVPLGSAQHQKLIVVDDAIAFTGGLDVTIRRWDTPAHKIDNPHRVDPAGKQYPPFHDVQMLVDGAAAGALALIARARWASVAAEEVGPSEAGRDPWPPSVSPDFTDIMVGIARTEPPYMDRPETREVEQLFLDSIDAAERSIYIENQFLTCAKLANRLALRLRQRPRLEAVIVGPRSLVSWLAVRTMRNGRIRFKKILHEAGVGDRVRLVYPEVTAGARTTDVMIHSKVMIVDDRLLRIGSANLNNRSMGTDTECDLVIAATNDQEHRAIARIRNALLAEHCGTCAGAAAEVIERTGSIIATAETLGQNGHCLRAIDDGDPERSDLAAYLEMVADPERPIEADAFVHSILGGRVRRRGTPAVLKVGAAALLVLALTLSWEFTPLAHFAVPAVARDALAALAHGAWAPVVVVTIFVVGGLVAFPVTVLIAATAAVFGPWLGFTYAAMGALASAVVTYVIGARLGTAALRAMLGPRLNRVRQKIARQGVLAIAAIRLIPIAPYTVVNLVAGASEIRLRDFVVGTIIGLTPGMIVMSALGHQIVRILADPSGPEIALLIGAAALWIAVSIGANVLLSRLGRKPS
jgi:phospholipase D1/2